QLLILGRLPINAAQKYEPLLVPVPLLAATDERTVERVERSKQRRSTVAFIVMGHARRTPLLQRQARLSPVERLDLTLFIAGQNQSVIGRVHIQPDDVLKLLHKLRIARHL